MSYERIILHHAKVVKCYFAFFHTFGELNSPRRALPCSHWRSITKSTLSFLLDGRKTVNVAYRYSPLALPLGELSPKVTERAFPLSVLASLGHLSQGERQGVLALEQAQQIVPLCLLTVKCDPPILPKADFQL